jgi:hypothetical protein
MDARRARSFAIASLSAVIALVAISLLAGWRAAGTTGPAAVGVTPGGDVWMGIGPELWRVSAQGGLREAVPAKSLGLPGPPANLLRHPDGHMLATVRHDASLYVLDPATARVVRKVTPQWPADLLPFASNAVNLAVAQDGRVAIATGRGDTVALFDADGRFLARTPEGTYLFTNGLWWEGDSLWTTDTNRFALRRLDGRTLAVQQSVALPADDAARFLGPARPAPDQVDALAALIRFRNGMTVGRVVLVGRDGRERAASDAGDSQPVDLDWLGDKVLVTDGGAFEVRAWNARSDAPVAFGDPALQERLRQLRRTRSRLQAVHDVGLAASVALLLVALLLARRAGQQGTGLP